MLDPNTPNNVAADYERRIQDLHQHYEDVVRRLMAEVNRTQRIAQILEGDHRAGTLSVRAVKHVEQTAEGLVIYI